MLQGKGPHLLFRLLCWSSSELTLLCFENLQQSTDAITYAPVMVAAMDHKMFMSQRGRYQAVEGGVGIKVLASLLQKRLHPTMHGQLYLSVGDPTFQGYGLESCFHVRHTLI